jgi:hypothetical protein
MAKFNRGVGKNKRAVGAFNPNRKKCVIIRIRKG